MDLLPLYHDWGGGSLNDNLRQSEEGIGEVMEIESLPDVL